MRYRRERMAGGCYFFTVVTHNRLPILTLPENIDRLRQSLRREKQRNSFEIDAMVVLPEHLHCLWRLPEEDTDYSGRWNRIKRYFSKGCSVVCPTVSASRLAKREYAVWQRRFWEHRIRDDRDWRTHMDYIHYNPVKHGYAGSPAEWPYGSFKQCIERGLYEPNWGANGMVEIEDIEAGE
ncbi:MAG: transposase [Deltaproteobacteria bacterium]|nr:transposase [Deltaproteobacteria bacterium]